ncbi:MAG: aminotransferase class I/II-fold pyridoxal phosphate-dependent enzyme [Phycisphaerae bacterium]|nr:aminotransferase class I/II-fold pyridoxal phosphate-dependent enzyme [Phycisphaerae bacterium]
MDHIDASGVRRMFELAVSRPKAISLTIGQPDFDVPEPCKEAAIEAIRSGRNAYTVTQGLPELRERIARELKDRFDWAPEVLVTSGTSGGILLALFACLDPGDEVIYADPFFVLYKYAIHLVGGSPVAVSSYPDFRMPIAGIEAAITERTRILLINSPSNPTGTIYSAADLKAAAELARKHDLLIVSDEIYTDLSFDGPSPSIVPHAPERTILLRGFSKGHAMTGWRLGYAAGPAPVIGEMIKAQQYTFVCAPSIVQYAGLVAMDTDISANVEAYRHKRDLVYEGLKDAFEIVRPGGGFYVFPKVPEGFSNSTEFVSAAAERDVLVVPGNIFSNQDTHFRLSYATTDEKIVRGCEILSEVARC